MTGTVSQTEFETAIANDVEEYSGEYRLHQVAPHFRAYCPVLPVHSGSVEQVRGFLETLGEYLQGLLRLTPTGVEVYHHSDRCYAGYASIYRALKALAPHLADARFFVAETDSRWVDEYRFVDEKLWFQRVRLPDHEGRTALDAHLAELASTGDTSPTSRNNRTQSRCC